MSLDMSLTIVGCPYCGYDGDVWSGNATHNLLPMWRKAGVSDALYNSDGKLAKEITEKIQEGLAHMLEHKSEYVALNPSNGWGNYEGAVAFLQNLFNACLKYPNSKINIWS
jgi:hypothetical protein